MHIYDVPQDELPMKIPYPLLFLSLSTFGCSATEFGSDENSPDDTGPKDQITESDTDVLPTDSPPQFWSISGSWNQEGGEIQTESISLELSFWARPRDLVCTYAVGVTVVSERYEVRPDSALYSWWSLSLKNPVDDGECPWRLPISDGDDVVLALGFGAYDSRLDGALNASGVDPTGSSTFGLFMSEPNTDNVLTIFGVAGTEAQYTSVEPVSEETPVADGTYLLTALYLLPYE